MMRRLVLIVAGMALMGAGNPQPPTEPQVGLVFKGDRGEVINGWKLVAASLYPKRVVAKGVTMETLECCLVEFQRNRTILLVKVDGVERNARGGFASQRIVLTYKVRMLPGEELDNGGMPLSPYDGFSLVNMKTGIVRSIVFNGEAFREWDWLCRTKTYDDCEIGED